MKKFLILAAADISKAQPPTQSTSNSASSNGQHRNITIDSDEPMEVRNTGQFVRNGCVKFILKEIHPNASEALITAFEYEGKIYKQQPSIDPKSLVGKVLEVNECDMDFCRGILLLKCDRCQISGMTGDSSASTGMDDLFDDEDLLDLSFI